MRDLRRRAAIHEDEVFGLAEHVDEARSDDQFADVDARTRRRGAEVADGGDAIAVDGKVGAHPRGAGAVNEPAADQDDVIGRRLAGRNGRTER